MLLRTDWQDEGLSTGGAARTAGGCSWPPPHSICPHNPGCIQVPVQAICSASHPPILLLLCMITCRCILFIGVSCLPCRGVMARRALRDARRAATLIAATWRGYVGRRTARQQRRDTAATRIAAAWRCHRARTAFKAHQVQCSCACVIHELRDMWSLLCVVRLPVSQNSA